jgi:hypothetical protein
VTVQPGQTRTVKIDIPVKELAYYDPQGGWTVEPISYVLIAGQHSLDSAAQRATFKVY